MSMLAESLHEVNFNVTRSLKQNFLLNALDGSEDHVNDRLFTRRTRSIMDFRKELMDMPPSRNFNEMVKIITPPDVSY